MSRKMSLALLFASVALIGNGYLFYLHFKKNKTTKDKYREEINLFFALMKAYGFSKSEAADMLFQYKDYESLRAANRKAKMHMRPAV